MSERASRIFRAVMVKGSVSFSLSTASLPSAAWANLLMSCIWMLRTSWSSVRRTSCTRPISVPSPASTVIASRIAGLIGTSGRQHRVKRLGGVRRSILTKETAKRARVSLESAIDSVSIAPRMWRMAKRSISAWLGCSSAPLPALITGRWLSRATR